MERLNLKLNLIQQKIEANHRVKIMIIGLGSVGVYLLDYLVSRCDDSIEIIIAGRNLKKIESDINIIKTAACIRGQLKSSIVIDSECDLEDISTIEVLLRKHKPDIVVNTSRVYAGLKYGSISWHNLRAYGIWTPLAVRYIHNIMLATKNAQINPIVINTSYSDAVIPWLKSAGMPYPDFGSGNLNHLIPRIKFYIGNKFDINDLSSIDVTLATSHFHDVVISKEGHSEGIKQLLTIKHNGSILDVDQNEVFKNCSISMPTDQKRNMMNASSNYNIIDSILTAIVGKKLIKVHTPGVVGLIGGYPIIIDGTSKNIKAFIDESNYSLIEMQSSNRESIALDGIEDIEKGRLIYTDKLLNDIKRCFNVELPKSVMLDDSFKVAELIIEKIIIPNKKND